MSGYLLLMSKQLPYLDDCPLAVDIRRGGYVESTHLVDIAVVDSNGRIILGYGETERPVFPRSQIACAFSYTMVPRATFQCAFGHGHVSLSWSSQQQNGGVISAFRSGTVSLIGSTVTDCSAGIVTDC